MHPRLTQVRPRVRAALFVAIAAATRSATASAAPPSPPPAFAPLENPPSDQHHPGKIIFAELVTPDLPAAQNFYEKLFGWTFQTMRMGPRDVAEAFLRGHPVAAIIGLDMPPGPPRPPAWLTFIATQNVDAAVAAATSGGGKILFAAHDIPRLGREAVLADPQGAVFAALASGSGDPADVLPDPGAWIWSSLITRDPDAAASFYQSLFTYDVFDLPDAGDAQHLILASDKYARASINPPYRQDAHPFWLNYIRVTDAAAMSAKVVALNGRVLVPPRTDRHGARISVVADPRGAAFGLMEWPDDATTGGAK